MRDEVECVLRGPIIVRTNTLVDRRVVQLLEELSKLTGKVKKQPITYPKGCVGLSHLRQFAASNGFSGLSAGTLWRTLLLDSPNGKRSSAWHHCQCLAIRHADTGLLRHAYLAGIDDADVRQKLLRDPHEWIIYERSVIKHAEAIIGDRPRNLGDVGIKLLRVWVANTTLLQDS